MPGKKKTSLFINTVKLFQQGITNPIGMYVTTKDFVRTIKQKKPSIEGRGYFEKEIHSLLLQMKVKIEIKHQVMAKVCHAKTVEELSRAKTILELLKDHGLKKEVADQFFLGGHFRLADKGALFQQLKLLKGSETRFSSHFASCRVEEKGLSAGRILPEILFLKTIEQGVTYSHFQLEASPWRQVPKGGLRNWVPNLQSLHTMEHVFDSLTFFAAKKLAQKRGLPIFNRSSYGWSPYADNNPITSLDALPGTKTHNMSP